MKEFGDGRDRDRRKGRGGGGDHEKRFFKLQAAKTGHFCIERQTEVKSLVGDGDI